jgi:ferredoxin
MNRTEVTTYRADIFVAGDRADAERICRQHCMAVGLCVTVEPVAFIYTGGQEAGVRVGLINYARFPAEPAEIFAEAEELALRLIDGLCQHSASVVASDRTVWLSRRAEPNH